MEAAARPLKVPKGCTEAPVAAGEALWARKAGAFRCSTSACRGGRPAAVMEAAARGLEPLKVPKGSFESLQKLAGPARRQLRSLQEKLSGPAWRVLRCCA